VCLRIPVTSCFHINFIKFPYFTLTHRYESLHFSGVRANIDRTSIHFLEGGRLLFEIAFYSWTIDHLT
ncbi:hypothetical protein L9F63_006495, partial [Diploptera punctata]